MQQLNHRIIYDIIVIGSGPAGCAAAAICRQAGLAVIIVTDQPQPVEFTSSFAPLESIHPGVSTLLSKIGLAGPEVNATRSLYSGIYSDKTYAPLGEDASGIWQGMHINREVFNAALINQTKDLGIDVIFNERVEDFILEEGKVIGIKTSAKDLFAKFVIDASGKKAIAGKKLKFKQKFFSPPLVCWTGVSKIDATFPFDLQAAHFIPHKEGWTWLAPQPPEYCAWTRLSIKGEKSFLPPDELKTFTTIGKIHAANMRWRLYRPVCSEGIILCGDAAGLLDPAAGQGIFNALMSGIQAGNTVVKCVTNSDLAAFHLAQYDDWFKEQFEEKVRKLSLYYDEYGISIFGRT